MLNRHTIIVILIVLSLQPAMGLSEPGDVEPTKYHQFVITNASPIEFYPSDIKTINITLHNIYDYSAFGVSTVIDPNKADPLKFTGELQKYVADEIGPNQDVTIQYEIYIKDNVPKGTYYIPVTVLWSAVKDGTVKRPDDLFIGITVAENPEGNKIEVNNIIFDANISSGSDFKGRVILRNLGKDKINNIKVSIPIQFPFSAMNSGTEKFIKSLEPNESTEVEFNFYVDKQAVSRIYIFNLTLEYKDIFNRIINQQSNFGILVEEKPHVYLENIIIDPQILEPGDTGLLTMQVNNAGTNEIKNVRFSIKGGEGILMQSENFIGQIGPKKSSTLSFGIYINPKLKIGDYGLNFHITYEDANGINHEYSYLYPVSIVSFPLLPITKDTMLVFESMFLFMLFSYVIFLLKGKNLEKRMKE